MLSVGPSPGVGPGSKPDRKSSPPSVEPPALGQICPKFGSEKWKKRPFSRHLLAIVKNGFEGAALPSEAEDSCLSIFLHMNLDIHGEGHERNIPQEMLNAGFCRFRTVFELVRPRLVIALTRRTYKTILKGASGGWPGTCVSVGEERSRLLRVKHRLYEWKNCWLEFPDRASVLLTRIPQHPIKAATIPRYDEIVGRYLADCVREIVTTERSLSAERREASAPTDLNCNPYLSVPNTSPTPGVAKLG
jgi:hypothetical protein